MIANMLHSLEEIETKRPPRFCGTMKLFDCSGIGPSTFPYDLLAFSRESLSTVFDSIDLFNQNTKATVYYSHARHDRSGAVVHDMLLAHAYSFQQGGRYGGSCVRNTHDVVPQNHKECVDLLSDLGWDKALTFACPTLNDTDGESKVNEILVDPDIYRPLDAERFTREWQTHFSRQVQTIPKQQDVYSIAVHIRRGDVNPCHYPDRYLPNNHYLRLIQDYLPGNESKKVVVTIYSEKSTGESLTVFKKEHNCELALDSPLSEVWRALWTADVAILSKSSFSYVPAILNTNTVVYTDFWHAPVKGWKTVGKDMLQQAADELSELQQQKCSVDSVQITETNLTSQR